MRMRKDIYLKEDDILILITYLKHGYSLQETISLFPLSLSNIKKQIEKGNSLDHIVIHYLPKKYQADTLLFLKMLPLEIALEAALNKNNFQYHLWKELKQKSIYPIFLLLISFTLLQLFQYLIMPMMMSSFSFLENGNNSFILINILHIICNGIMICMVITLFILLCMLIPKIQSMILLRYAKHSKIIRTYLSLIFVSSMEPFVIHGIATIDIMEHLKEHQCLWLQELSQCIHQYLLQGYCFEDAFDATKCFDHEWLQCLKRAVRLSNINDMIHFYLEVAKQKLIKWMHRMIMIMQCITYGFIAALVLVVFQMMLLPLTMLETF